jgi:hypothetical protein
MVRAASVCWLQLDFLGLTCGLMFQMRLYHTICFCLKMIYMSPIMLANVEMMYTKSTSSIHKASCAVETASDLFSRSIVLLELYNFYFLGMCTSRSFGIYHIHFETRQLSSNTAFFFCLRLVLFTTL